MRVTYVTIQFPAPSETFATNEVRVLANNGVEISVHCLRRAHPNAARLGIERGLADMRITHNGILATLRGAVAAVARPRLLARSLAWILRANRHNRQDLVMSLLLLPRAFDILVDVERTRPDVLHMYWGHFPTLVGFLVQERCPIVTTSMSIVAYDLARRYGGTVTVAQRADVIRTHARANLEELSSFTGIPPDRINVIYNGADIPWLTKAMRVQERVSQRVVTVARLVENKGVDDVLVAFSKVRARWPSSTLVVVGDGPDRTRLRALCDTLQLGDSVHFTGQLAHAKAVQEIAKADVMLLLSRCTGERLPNAVKEGMVCGCICVTTPTPGIGELVEHGASGFVVPMSDPPAAHGVIDRIFSGQVDVTAMTDKAEEHIRRHFDLDRTAPQYVPLWRAAIQRRRLEAASSSAAHD